MTSRRSGNVAEWVSPAPGDEPSLALLKGGSWLDADPASFRVSARALHPRDLGFYLIGFRCARSAP
jgi:formylglycine-generating enzyme required for sulfatase activity